MLLGTPIVHSSVIGGWYCWRSSRLRSKPPAASSTPRSAKSWTALAVADRLDADHPAVLDDQPLERGVRADLAVAGVHERQQRPADQRLAADHRLGRFDAPSFGPQRRAHERFELAELGALDRRREDRAALAQRAGGVGEVVGHAAPVELAESPGSRSSSSIIRGPACEVRLAERDGGVVADDRVEVRAGGLRAAFEAGAHLGRVAGQPDAGARLGGRAADVLRLLDHQRPQSAGGRGIGAEQPAARADDDDVEVLAGLPVVVVHRSRRPLTSPGRASRSRAWRRVPRHDSMNVAPSGPAVIMNGVPASTTKNWPALTVRTSNEASASSRRTVVAVEELDVDRATRRRW